MYKIMESFRFVECEPKEIGTANTIEEAKKEIENHIKENYPEKIRELSDLGSVNRTKSKTKHVLAITGVRYLIELID